ncbi:MAG: PAS domain S-box protein [Pseudomonadota bacterium]
MKIGVTKTRYHVAVATSVLLLGLCITYYAGIAVHKNAEAQLGARNKASSEIVASSVQTHIVYRIRALERMARRLQRDLIHRDTLDLVAWRLDAREFFASQPGYIALQILDADVNELVTMPVLEPKVSIELYAHFEKQNPDKLVPGRERAAQANAVGTIQMSDGRRVLALAFPLFRNDVLRGYLVSFMDAETFLGYVLRKDFNTLPNVLIMENNRLIWEHGTLARDRVEPVQLKNLVRFGRINWTVRASRYADFNPMQHVQVRNFAAVGVIGSLLFSGLAFLAMRNYNQVKQQLRAEQRARESEHFLQLIVDHTPDLIFVKDANFKIRQMNKAMLALYPGKSLDDIVGTTTIEDYDEKEAEEFLRFDRIAFLEGRSETEESIMFPNGKREVLLTSKLRFYDDSGNAFILGVGRVITALKQTEEKLISSEERYKLAVHGTSVGIWDMDLVNGKTFWSDRYCAILGIKHSVEPRDEEFIQRLHPDDRDRALRAMEDHVSKRKPHFDVEFRMRHDDGNYVWIHSRGQAAWDKLGNPVRVVGSIDDITDKKVAMQELLRSNQELDDFAYIASHDLKEPLRGIHNHVRFLEEDYLAVLGEDGQHRIERLKFLVKRLEKLINDLLEYSRLGRVELRKRQVNLNELVRDIALSVEEEKASITVTSDLPTLLGSEVQLAQLFRNLITNALKYNNADEKQVLVSCSAGQHSSLGNTIVFSVADNGIGIPPQFREDVFKIFKRLHGPDEYPGGTGSGLTFAKKIVERYRGEIWLDGNDFGGTTVFFSLPDALQNQV